MEPTKDFVPAVSSHEHKTVSAQAPPGLQDTSAPSADSVQVQCKFYLLFLFLCDLTCACI